MNLLQEFDKQVQNLIQKEYPKIMGVSEAKFIKLLNPLRTKVDTLNLPEINIVSGYLPFVIVINNNLIPTEEAMSLVIKDGRNGITKLFPLEPADFKTITEINIPDCPIYLLIDIDRGKDYINQPPSEAMHKIVEGGRSPLTIDEGIAIITHYPDFLMKNNCYSLLASRHTGDQRVPAIWINGAKRPNLGWCWNGNPHTWLGSVSCKERIC